MPPFGHSSVAEISSTSSSPATKETKSVVKRLSKNSSLANILTKSLLSPVRKSRNDRYYPGKKIVADHGDSIDSTPVEHSTPTKSPTGTTSFEKYSPAERAYWAAPQEVQKRGLDLDDESSPIKKVLDFSPKKSALKPKENTVPVVATKSSSSSSKGVVIKLVSIFAVSVALLGTASMLRFDDKAASFLGFNENNPPIDDEFLDLQLKLIAFETGL